MKKRISKLLLCGLISTSVVSPLMGGSINAIAAENTSLATIKSSEYDWENMLITCVNEDSALNIRSDGSTDSKIVGKMYCGSVANVIEKGDEWSKIDANGIEGYVKNEYVEFADIAAGIAAETIDTVVVVTADDVRLRKEPNFDCGIYKLMSIGEAFLVSESQDYIEDGWVEVVYGDGVAYISTDYVEKDFAFPVAKTIEELTVVKRSKSSGNNSSSSSGEYYGESSGATYSSGYFKKMGVIYDGGHKFTWYSEKTLPGQGLNIPGRHLNDGGYVCDENGYICLASNDYGKGTVVDTPFGTGKVYDCGCDSGTLDVYVGW